MFIRPAPTLTTLLALAIILASPCHDALCQEEPTVPDQPQFIPQLSVEQRPGSGDRIFTMAQIAILEMDDFKCEVWCYEDRFGTGEAEMQDDGSLLLTHTHEQVTLKTHLVPEPGALVFNIEASGPDPEQVKRVRSVNPCWQLREAEAFGNRGDFYQDFVSRCFIYTVRGLTLMKDTTRFPDTRRPADDKVNVNPWVQVYLPIWRRHGGQPEAFWGSSTDRPIYSIIGCVSRDGKYLTAFGWPKSSALSQGWHDCLHEGPDFSDFYDRETNKVVCHGKLYFMQNDPDALLERYLEDFPQPEPALSIEPEPDGAVKVTHRDLPDEPLELSDFPGEWEHKPWGTWTTMLDRPDVLLVAWVRPHDEFANVYVGVHNRSQHPGPLDLTPRLDATDPWRVSTQQPGRLLMSREDGWVAGFVFEQTEAVVAPGEEVTVRGRIRIFKGTLDGLRKLLDEDAAEWQRASPFKLPISLEGPG
jgi:hypothetical protein